MTIYRLTQGAFVLIGGRIGAVYGHKNTVVVAGIFWVIPSGLRLYEECDHAVNHARLEWNWRRVDSPECDCPAHNNVPAWQDAEYHCRVLWSYGSYGRNTGESSLGAFCAVASLEMAVLFLVRGLFLTPSLSKKTKKKMAIPLNAHC